MRPMGDYSALSLARPLVAAPFRWQAKPTAVEARPRGDKYVTRISAVGFAAEIEAHGPLTIGLAERSKVLQPIEAGELLTHENCALDETLAISEIRRRLDETHARFL